MGDVISGEVQGLAGDGRWRTVRLGGVTVNDRRRVHIENLRPLFERVVSEERPFPEIDQVFAWMHGRG